MDFLIGIETGVLDDHASKIQIKRPPQRGECDATRRDAEEYQILNAARSKKQVEMVLRKGRYSLLIDDKFLGTRNGAVEFGGKAPFYEKIVVLHSFESGLHIADFGMPFRESKSHMNNQKSFLPRKFHGFGCIREDGLGAGRESKNPLLKIERQ